MTISQGQGGDKPQRRLLTLPQKIPKGHTKNAERYEYQGRPQKPLPEFLYLLSSLRTGENALPVALAMRTSIAAEGKESTDHAVDGAPMNYGKGTTATGRACVAPGAFAMNLGFRVQLYLSVPHWLELRHSHHTTESLFFDSLR